MIATVNRRNNNVAGRIEEAGRASTQPPTPILAVINVTG